MGEPENNIGYPIGEETTGPDSMGYEPKEEPAAESGVRLSKADLIKRVKALCEKHQRNRSWVSLMCEELNAEGILTVKGKKWEDQNLRRFVDENLKEFKPGSAKEPADAKPARGRKKTSQETAKTSPEKGTRASKPKVEEPEKEPAPERPKTLLLDDRYPAFRDDVRREQVSCRLSKELVNRAKEKLRNDVPRSGKGLPQLLELLLWHYLDQPEEFLWMHQGKKW